MNIVTVIPIGKASFKEELVYFSGKNILPGSIVSIPLRQKNGRALVVKSEPAAELKTELRSSDFKLKKITEVLATNLFTPEFLSAAGLTARYHLAATGQIIKNLTPRVILENLAKLSPAPSHEPLPALTGPQHWRLALQEPDPERFAFYKSLVREAFARQKSVFLLLPSSNDMKNVLPVITKGIEDYTFVLHPGLPAKTILDTWQKALITAHPILIIATPLFLSLPRHDIGTIIVDKENSGGYRPIARPRFDTRFFAEQLAAALSAKLIFGDMALRTETIYRVENGELNAAAPIKYRAFSEARQSLINTKPDQTAGNRPKNWWQPLAKNTAELLRQATAQNERTVIFAGRRGLGTVTICRDCGEMITCPECRSPMVVHQKKRRDGGTGRLPTIFMCHHCQRLEDTDTVCRHCGSWHLESFGGGSERLAAAVAELLPEAKILVLDSDHAPTAKQARDIVADFLTSPGSILIGTEMIMHYLHEKIENIIIAGIDGLFTLPDFRIREKIFVTLLRLRGNASKNFAIQTRNPAEPIIDYVLKGNALDSHRDELTERQKFHYPPFSRLIKINREGPKPAVVSDMEKLAAGLAEYQPIIFPAFTPGKLGHWRLHAIIRLPVGDWQSHAIRPELAAKLEALPLNFVIEVDPEDIL